MSDVTERTALELADLIRRRELSSREVVTAFLDRIETVNPAINAVVRTLDAQAFAAADQADAMEPVGPLHGVPFTVKENIDVLGTPTTDGIPAFADELPTADAPVVTRMRSAGAIPLARTNLPELGLRYDTDNPLHGRTANPWDRTRTPGGSSGGEAAAIAAGLSPLGLGNDIAGSLRNPAFCCGVVGFRPTIGRVPMVNTVPPVNPQLSSQLMSTDGPIGLDVASVRTSARLLDGADPHDPRSVDVAFHRPLGRRRAGLVTGGWASTTLSPNVRNALVGAADALTDAGWEVEATTLPELERVGEVWLRIMAMDIPPLIEAIGPLVTPRLRQVLEDHVTYHVPDAIPPSAVFSERWRLARKWTDMFRRTPIVIAPVWHIQAFEAGADLAGGMDVIFELMQFLTPGALLGLPAIAVPTGVADGLPVGVQLYADRWNDEWCFEAATAIENRLGRIAPISPGTH